MNQEELHEVAKALVAPGKGILAADEPIEYMEKCLCEIGLKNSEENRRRYRQILFTTDDSISNYLSGVILHPETAHQKTDSGISFIELLKRKKIFAGVTVDRGIILLHGSNSETTAEGLDDLYERCRFAKWRVALKITANTPSRLAIKENARLLARYASVCQAGGLVPLVEPEVQLEGNHDLLKAQEVTEAVMTVAYKALHDYGVFLEGTVLKASMVLPGQSNPGKCNAADIAKATITAFLRTVPAAVPGIGFLSGGQTPDQATQNLLAINRCDKKPWALTFIYGRALQQDVPRVWAGREENVTKAQMELLKRAKANSNASMGVLEELKI